MGQIPQIAGLAWHHPHRGNVWRSLAPFSQAPLRTATAEGHVEAGELLQHDLAALIRRRPDIGVSIYRNLAVGLGDKLLRSGNPKRD
ncbi:MAG TPA: hypothetical protein VK901_09465 [Nitrospiraceae bacterium]|nr:hypothetical protein [Nitrospiraceae bacterium]